MSRVAIDRALIFGGLFLMLGSCAGSQPDNGELVCREEEGRQQCVQSGGAGQGIVTGVGAGVLWATSGGCKIAGCQPPLECNQETERCQPMRCDEDLKGCPSGYLCHAQTRTCR